MTPAVTETVPQESGVHFSSPLGLMNPSVEANLCLDNSKSMQCSDPLDSCSSGLIYTGNDLCLQKDYTKSEGGCPLSPQYEFFVSSSGINVDRKHSSIWKAEKDADRQSFCTRAGVRPHFAERNIKRKLFPGSVSQVLADVNKLWDLSVTETEGMSGSPKYRLNGRIEGESLAVPLACHYSSLEVTDLEKEPQKMPNKKSEVRSTFQRCLYRQQALRTRAQRNKKRLELLLTNHVVEHCSQQISGFVKDQIKKRKSDISPAFRRSNDSETDHSALDSSRMDLYGGNSQTKDLKPVFQDFCIRMTNKLKSVEQDLDSDATGSSSDEDWEEIARKSHECDAEWKWLLVRAHVASRWTWLQTHISDLEYKIQQAAHLQSQIRNEKGTLVFEEPSAEKLVTPTVDIKSSPLKDLDMSPSSPTLLLRHIEKQSAQLTEMVSSLMTALPFTLSPNPVKSFKNENGATGFPHRVNKATSPKLRRSQKSHPVKKRTSSRSSSARIRPLKLYHKRNLYRLGSACTALSSNNAVYYHESLQISNLSSNQASCDKPQQSLLVRSNVCEIDSHFHPVLSLASDFPLHLYLEGFVKSNGKYKEDVVDSTRYRQEDDDTVTLNFFTNDMETENICATTPSSQKSSSQIRDSSVVGSAQRRRLRSENSYDIDKIVIPMNLVAPIKIEKIQYKQIMTPSWKEMVYQPLGTIIDEEMEDLSDEVFTCRHEKYEQKERTRWLFWQHNKRPKKSRSSGTGFGIWPGSISPAIEETCSPCYLSPIAHNLLSSFANGYQNAHTADQLHQERIDYWERRLFPLTEAAALALVLEHNAMPHTHLPTKTPPHVKHEKRSPADMNR